MKALIILDPIEKLKLTWDSSIYLLRELTLRGHEVWTCDAPDIRYESDRVVAYASKTLPKNLNGGSWDPKDNFEVYCADKACINAQDFHAILIRKEPPFDDTYLYMTHLLELVAHIVPVMNHPRGIRNTNEKLGILKFPDWIPNTLVTSSGDAILDFQKKHKTDLVIKPLELKGGGGVFKLSQNQQNAAALLQDATRGGTKTIMAQEFIASPDVVGDKRILVFDYKLWAAYERHAPQNDFRSNVAVGGSYHKTEVSEKEKALVEALIPYLKDEELSFVGIDVMQDKLIEINVTCSAGLCELKNLYPQHDYVGEWADYVQKQAGHYAAGCDSSGT